MLVGYEGLVEYLPMVSIPIWILGFLVIIASLLLLWCLRVLAMLLGGGPIYGQEKYEKNSDYLVSCQKCGEELELVEDSNFVQDGVRCPVCHEIFRLYLIMLGGLLVAKSKYLSEGDNIIALSGVCDITLAVKIVGIALEYNINL